jgi:hypothetical protein
MTGGKGANTATPAPGIKSQLRPSLTYSSKSSRDAAKARSGQAGAVLKDGVYRWILDGFQNKPNAANAGLQRVAVEFHE